MKKFRLLRFSLVALVIIVTIVHTPSVISVSNGMGTKRLVYSEPAMISTAAVETSAAALSLIYEHLNLSSMGLSEQAFNCAARGYTYLKEKGKIINTKFLSIIDFSLPSSKKRLFVVDVEESKLVFNTFVAHGQNTGEDYARRFSNQPDSHQSSLGFYLTNGTYMGKNGFSMQLDGLEYGINSNAEQRAIVMHGAPYVSEGFIRNKGYLGRSHGCPAVPESMNKPIIQKIKNGSCLFIYGNDKNYLNRSKILHT